MDLLTDGVEITCVATDVTGKHQVSFHVPNQDPLTFDWFPLQSHDWALKVRVRADRTSWHVKAGTRAEVIAAMLGWFNFTAPGRRRDRDESAKPGMSLDSPRGSSCVISSIEGGEMSKMGVVTFSHGGDDPLDVEVRIARTDHASGVELWPRDDPGQLPRIRSTPRLEPAERRSVRAGSPLRWLEIIALAQHTDAQLLAMAGAALAQKVSPYLRLPPHAGSA
jgi:hypothetical protein